ncbi:fibronectin type III domain-containing protein [Bacillus cereus group sp. Bce018]|uniref:fibronectin type III domain-containing protein n=1 Tax=Bacillus cereus group sp. Bce018 TaxID=3445248 RepID=UPI003F2604F2
MRFRKYFAVFSIMMIMGLSVLPSFSRADSENLISGTIGTDWRGNKYKEMTDDDLSTFSVINPFSDTRDFLEFKFNKKVNPKFISIILNKPIDVGQSFIAIGMFDGKEGPILQRIYNTGSDKVLFDLSDYYESNSKYYPDLVNGIEAVRFKLTRGSRPFEIAEIKVLNDFPFEDISDLKAVEGINDVSFTWKNPNDSKLTGVSIYKENVLLGTVDKSVNSFKVEGLEGNKNYNFKFVAKYGERSSSGIQKGVKTLIDPKTVPPNPVSSFTAEPTDKTVKLKWKSPKDDDLAGFKILQNGKQVAEIGLEEEFTVKNLQPLTDYTFGVISVDRDKNDSPPVSLSVKTLEENDEEPPHVPSNVFAKPSNGALIASWDKVSDKDLAGYNVYVDGKKINSNLITSTTFVVKNLENGTKYKIQVQAVDRSKNVSELSLAAFGTPDVNTIPVIESNYGVEDVSDGVGTMFSQIWPALAFSVGIVLAFYVIYKLKHTILP